MPRALAEQVMAQVERPRQPRPLGQPGIPGRAPRSCPLRARVRDALRLRGQLRGQRRRGGPCLRYVNHKMKREALVPIDEEVRAEVIEQRERAGSSPWLFPRTMKKPDGRFPSRLWDLSGGAFPVAAAL